MLNEMAVREAAMAYVAALTARNGGVISRRELEDPDQIATQVQLVVRDAKPPTR
jgi:hypothetical protein